MSSPLPPAASAATAADSRERLLIHLGRVLHAVGFPAPQLEGALGRTAHALGVPARFFTTPTSIFSAFGDEQDQRVHLERVEPSSVDLGRLAALDALLVRFESGELAAGDALAEVERVAVMPQAHGPALRLVAFAVGSASSAVFLGGGTAEVVVGGAIGLVTGILAAILGRRLDVSRVFEPIAAALAAFLAIGFAHLVPGLSVYLATLAGLIVLLPGFSLTVALSELGARHLSSGSARFAGALVVFLSIAFGVAVGTQIGALAFGPVAAAVPSVLPIWIEPIALLVAPIAIGIQQKAPRSEAVWIVIGGFLAFQTARIGAEVLSSEYGAFFGALALGFYAAVYARLRNKPALVVLVPGLLMLVPGSIGYKSLSSLVARDVVLGLESAVRVVLVTLSLVAGLLAAHAFAPARRRIGESSTRSSLAVSLPESLAEPSAGRSPGTRR